MEGRQAGRRFDSRLAGSRAGTCRRTGVRVHANTRTDTPARVESIGRTRVVSTEGTNEQTETRRQLVLANESQFVVRNIASRRYEYDDDESNPVVVVVMATKEIYPVGRLST